MTPKEGELGYCNFLKFLSNYNIICNNNIKHNQQHYQENYREMMKGNANKYFIMV